MDLVKIGSYIAEKRKKLGMTQKQLAEKLGKSDKSVSKWERGICLPDVSVYLELCEILGISLNEFLAGEDIEVTNVEKKSEDTLIQISKDSSHKQRYLKKIIAVLLIAVGVFAITLGIMVCNKLRQPQNYIEAVDPDSVEMKTAELLSGIDGTMMFRYNSKDTFQALYVYLSEYHSGKRVSHKRVLELSYEDVKSAKNGLIVITPDFDNFTAKLIAADEYSKYMTETPILEGVANREYYGRSATSIENKSTIEYGTEQGLAALIYGEQGVSSLPIQDITGEYIDTEYEGKDITTEDLDYIHQNKTGALLKLCVRMGAILADASENDIERLSKFADKIGLAFQIKDDILSEEGDAKITGKPVGNDKELGKCTYVSQYGLDGAKNKLEKITQEAIDDLEQYGEKAEFLKQLAIYIKERNK